MQEKKYSESEKYQLIVRNIILLRNKSSVFVATSTNYSGDNIIKLHNLYSSLYTSSSTTLRDVALFGYITSFTDMLFPPALVPLLPKELKSHYEDHQKKLISAGFPTNFPQKNLFDDDQNNYVPPTFSERLAAFLTYIDISNLISTEGKKDGSVVATKIVLESYLLRNFGDVLSNGKVSKLSAEEKQFFMEDLQKNLILIKEKRSTLPIKEFYHELYPLFAYTIGYDIATDFSKKTDNIDKNSSIDKTYSDLFASFKKYPSQTDNTKYLEVLSYMWYLNSLSRRYGEGVKELEERYVVEEMKKIFDSNINVYYGYEDLFSKVQQGFIWESVSRKAFTRKDLQSYFYRKKK